MMRVVDVYEAAAQIGKDFEFLIERFGVDSVGSLMPKVIRVLEELEQCAADRESASLISNKPGSASQRNEDEHKLELERKMRLGERAQFERELEQLDEAWRLETAQLSEAIIRLEDENKQLRNDLNTRGSVSSDSQRSPNPVTNATLTNSTAQGNEALSYSVYSSVSVASANQAELVGKLKALITAQRAELKALRKSLLEREGELDAFDTETRRTLVTIAEFRGLLCDRERRSVTLREERADLLVQLDAKEHLLRTVDESIAKQSAPFSGRVPASNVNAKWDNEVNGAAPRVSALPTDVRDMTVSFALGTSKRPSESDPSNSPGNADLNFSFAELSTLIRERTRLRIRLAEADTELNLYASCKPVGHGGASLSAGDGRLAVSSSPLRSGSRIDESVTTSSAEWDRAVQGPINREPDEKMFPERYARGLNRQASDRESKIKRLFQTVIDKLNELHTVDD